MLALSQEPFENVLEELYQHEVSDFYNVVKTMNNKYYEDATTSERQCCDSSCCKVNLKECGQNQTLREEAAAYWNIRNGEHIITSYIAHYLKHNAVTNPNYAHTDPHLI
ncbi:unnamed protein product [Leptidea sinapis]|uniref:Uncharacterized protein n=1 Tax=Leptidea sinapis TaxID=189913 RepID=A0A5E4R3Q7_9NEOP|nr:unnamed protein product [Leptidea sinapis]